MKLSCLHCGARIWKRSTNPRKNSAKCESCGHRQNLAYLIERSKLIGVYDPNHPPRGAKISRHGQSWEVRGSNWQWRHVFVLIVCLLMIVGSLCDHVPIEPNLNFVFHLIGFLLLPPVCIATFGFLLGVFLTFGGTRIRSDGTSLVIFDGVGWIGRTQRVQFGEVLNVRRQYVGNRHSSTGYLIVLAGKPNVYIGRYLNAKCQNFMLHTLRDFLSAALRPKAILR